MVRKDWAECGENLTEPEILGVEGVSEASPSEPERLHHIPKNGNPDKEGPITELMTAVGASYDDKRHR
jgi:hypothetical protein